MFPKWLVMEEEKGDTATAGGGGEINIDATVDSLAADLGLGKADDSADDGSSSLSGDGGERQAADPGAAAEGAAPAARVAPKSWPKEAHALWEKLEDPVRDLVERREQDFHKGLEQYREGATYGKALREVIEPFQALLEAQGIRDHSQAVRYLLSAHHQLSAGDDQRRAEALAGLVRSYRLDPAVVVKLLSGEAPPAQDPAQKALAERLDRLEGELSAGQRARLEAIRDENRTTVEKFASDPAHPYFDEVADHIVLLLQDPRKTLPVAYEEAVWANPVTRAKEQARLQKESEAALRKAAEEKAKAAAKAKGTVVRGRDTERPLHETLGSMDDTLKETLREINSRT